MWKAESTSAKLALGAKVVAKWLASFRTRQWTLEDYPLRFREQDTSAFEGPERLRPSRWGVFAYRWGGMQGFGNTKEEALSSLRSSFNGYIAEGKSLPRPGSYKKMEVIFASQEVISQFTDLEDDFINKVLNVQWALMTDESSLWDFHTEETNDSLYARIREIYGVDVTDVEGAKIAGILAKIASKD